MKKIVVLLMVAIVATISPSLHAQTTINFQKSYYAITLSNNGVMPAVYKDGKETLKMSQISARKVEVKNDTVVALSEPEIIVDGTGSVLITTGKNDKASNVISPKSVILFEVIPSVRINGVWYKVDAEGKVDGKKIDRDKIINLIWNWGVELPYKKENAKLKDLTTNFQTDPKIRP